MKKRIIILAIVFFAAIGSAMAYFYLRATPDTPKASTTKTTTTKPNVSTDQPAKFSKTKYSLTDPTSIWIIANKHRALNPTSYAPADLVIPSVPKRSNITGDEQQLRKEASTALEVMVAAAKKDNINLTLQSGYRSYNFQVTLYNRYVQQQGQAEADTQSARPGFSEHQTGLAADLGSASKPSCNIEDCFKDTDEGKWVAAHAYEYGFVIRYPEGKQAITGYIYEPWHLRFVGVDLATEMHQQNIVTLEEFFGLEPAPSYN